MNNKKYFIALLILIGILPLELNGLYNSAISNTPFVYWTVEILTWILLPSILLWISFQKTLFAPSDIGLHTRIFGRPNWFIFIPVSLIIAIGVVLSDSFATSFAHDIFSVNYGFRGFFYGDLVPTSGLTRFLVLLHLCLSAGIVEEIYFRGMARLLFPSNVFGSLLYVIISSIAFSSIHWEGGVRNLTETLIFGLSTSILYVISGNLWPLIIGHALNDYFWFR